MPITGGVGHPNPDLKVLQELGRWLGKPTNITIPQDCALADGVEIKILANLKVQSLQPLNHRLVIDPLATPTLPVAKPIANLIHSHTVGTAVLHLYIPDVASVHPAIIPLSLGAPTDQRTDGTRVLRTGEGKSNRNGQQTGS
ncbi:hypothetical protein DWG14_00101 [Streptomyces griseorubiginosus]|uniref:Uncharacterized protein n=1 Tax=Streptomyces griseorubiginosus TaxID=67304 RepID=A0AAI8KUA1_9ACTN|nr:hypothetical protein DWG14_00101 [Streptomyces griseorubiginosus]